MEPGRGTLDGQNATLQSILGNITSNEENFPLESSALVLGDVPSELVVSESNDHGPNLSNDSGITSEPVHKTGTISAGDAACGNGRIVRHGENNTLNGEDSYITEFNWPKETKGGIMAAFYYGLTFSQVEMNIYILWVCHRKIPKIRNANRIYISILHRLFAKLTNALFWASFFLRFADSRRLVR